MSVESLMFINLFSHLLKSTTKYFISRVMHSTATDWSRSRYWNLMLKQRKINKLNDLKGCTAAGSLSSVFFVGYFFRHSTIPRCIVLYHILGNLIIKYPHQQLQCDENFRGPDLENLYLLSQIILARKISTMLCTCLILRSLYSIQMSNNIWRNT